MDKKTYLYFFEELGLLNNKSVSILMKARKEKKSILEIVQLLKNCSEEEAIRSLSEYFDETAENMEARLKGDTPVENGLPR